MARPSCVAGEPWAEHWGKDRSCIPALFEGVISKSPRDRVKESLADGTYERLTHFLNTNGVYHSRGEELISVLCYEMLEPSDMITDLWSNVRTELEKLARVRDCIGYVGTCRGKWEDNKVLVEKLATAVGDLRTRSRSRWVLVLLYVWLLLRRTADTANASVNATLREPRRTWCSYGLIRNPAGVSFLLAGLVKTVSKVGTRSSGRYDAMVHQDLLRLFFHLNRRFHRAAGMWIWGMSNIVKDCISLGPEAAIHNSSSRMLCRAYLRAYLYREMMDQGIVYQLDPYRVGAVLLAGRVRGFCPNQGDLLAGDFSAVFYEWAVSQGGTFVRGCYGTWGVKVIGYGGHELRFILTAPVMLDVECKWSCFMPGNSDGEQVYGDLRQLVKLVNWVMRPEQVSCSREFVRHVGRITTSSRPRSLGIRGAWNSLCASDKTTIVSMMSDLALRVIGAGPGGITSVYNVHSIRKLVDEFYNNELSSCGADFPTGETARINSVQVGKLTIRLLCEHNVKSFGRMGFEVRGRVARKEGETDAPYFYVSCGLGQVLSGTRYWPNVTVRLRGSEARCQSEGEFLNAMAAVKPSQGWWGVRVLLSQIERVSTNHLIGMGIKPVTRTDPYQLYPLGSHTDNPVVSELDVVHRFVRPSYGVYCSSVPGRVWEYLKAGVRLLDSAESSHPGTRKVASGRKSMRQGQG